MATIAEELAKAALTDSLIRAEAPIAGEWKLLKPGLKKGKAENGGAEKEGWTPESSFVEGADGAYWSKQSYGPTSGSLYAYAIAQIKRIADQEPRTTGLWVLRDKTAPETKESGYYLRVVKKDAEKNKGKVKFILEKWVNGVITEMKTAENETYTAALGAQIAIVAGNGHVYLYARKSEAEAFVQVLEVEDSTYNEGYAGMMAAGTGEFKIANFRAGTFGGEEEPGVMKPNPASANASIGEDAIAQHLVEKGGSGSANASMPNVELVGGAMPSATEREAKGLPLPFPSVLANPGRLGPPRFNAADRKTLGIKR